MIAIVDYGVGNLFSLCCSFRAVGADIEVSSDPKVISAADKIILPGVGAFEDAAKKLMESGLGELIVKEAENGKPLLGICLGMQLLFDKSYEYGEHEGLGLIPGEIVPISEVVPEGYKIPHMGWNALKLCQESPLFKYVKEGDYVYFVHSYYAKTDEQYVLASTEYGGELTAAAARGNVFGCQFHPEKSSDVGLGILKAFCEM